MPLKGVGMELFRRIKAKLMNVFMIASALGKIIELHNGGILT